MPARWATFLVESARNFETIGALLPSSGALAREICRPAASAARPVIWLEAGPGTGAFTARLLAGLDPDDRLILVEKNPKFVEILHQRFTADPRWRERREQVEIRLGSAAELPEKERYHGIVSGLPFSNFDPDLVEEILQGFWRRLLPGGVLSFFEYWRIRQMKAWVSSRAERRRLDQIDRVLEAALARGENSQTTVWANVPPAIVHHLRRPVG